MDEAELYRRLHNAVMQHLNNFINDEYFLFFYQKLLKNNLKKQINTGGN